MSSVLTSQPAETLWFLDNAARIHAEGPRWSLTEMRGRPGDMVPLHVHHDEDEVFHVLEGELELFVDGETLRLPADRIVVAPRGVPHAYRVCSPEPARWLALASETFAQFVRELGRPAESEALPEPSGPPTPEQVTALTQCAARHGIEMLGPPPFTA
jgi:mannose-6-phosphate isomerase-like protein (cupin superfamily)